MKLKIKRLLSMMLVFCMMFGMMSGMTVQAEGDDVTYVDIEIPVVKKVNDATAVGSFEFSLSMNNEVPMDVKDNTVDVTGGKMEYNDTFVISVPETELKALAECTLTIEEIDSDVRGWSYDSNAVSVNFVYDEETNAITGVEAFKENIGLEAAIPYALFDNWYEMYSLTVPFTTTVEVKGQGTAPAKEFDFKVNKLTWNEGGTATIGEELKNTKVATNGKGKYNGSVELDFTREELAENNTIFISEVDGSDNYWTCFYQMGYVVKIDPVIIASMDLEASSSYEISYYPAYINGETVTLKDNGNDVITKEQLNFVNEYTAPVNYQIEIPFTKEVKLGGGSEPGKTDFEFELKTFADADMKVEGNTITTNGKGVYEGKIIITVAEEDVMNLTEGMILTEKAVADTKWECDETAWFIGLNKVEVNSLDESRVSADLSGFDMFYCKAEKVETDNGVMYRPNMEEAAEKISFVNTYTFTEVEEPEADEPEADEPEVEVEESETPKTGDTTNIFMYLAVLLVSSLCVGVTLFNKKRRA